jgi:RND family efflux transporter MFP subunit
VEIVTAALKPVEQIGTFVGTVKSRQLTTVKPQAEGFITRIFVKSGDRVGRGTPILDIDARSQQAVVDSLLAQRTSREADATLARQQAERAEALLQAGAASQQDSERAAAQLEAALAQLASVDEQILQQRNNLGYYRVVAPTAGIIGDIPLNVGDSVTKSTALTTIDDNAGLEVYIGVPVELAPRLKLGLPVRLVADTGEVLAATEIYFVSPAVDDATQTLLVKASVPETASLRTSQFVRCQVVWTTEPTLTIPVVSVLRINGQVFGFVARPGEGGGLVAHQVPLGVGPVVGGDYVVESGLAEGDQLIVSGLQKIGDGAPVQALSDAPPAPAAPGAEAP